jgi:hypothetical protein
MALSTEKANAGLVFTPQNLPPSGRTYPHRTQPNLPVSVGVALEVRFTFDHALNGDVSFTPPSLYKKRLGTALLRDNVHRESSSFQRSQKSIRQRAPEVVQLRPLKSQTGKI